MKTLPLLTCLFFASTLSAQPFVRDTASGAITEVYMPAQNVVTNGMLRSEVLEKLGRPGTTVTGDYWIYWNFRALGRTAESKRDTLIVVFAKDRVRTMCLAERATVLALLNDEDLKAAHKALVAAK